MTPNKINYRNIFAILLVGVAAIAIGTTRHVVAKIPVVGDVFSFVPTNAVMSATPNMDVVQNSIGSPVAIVIIIGMMVIVAFVIFMFSFTCGCGGMS